MFAIKRKLADRERAESNQGNIETAKKKDITGIGPTQEAKNKIAYHGKIRV